MNLCKHCLRSAYSVTVWQYRNACLAANWISISYNLRIRITMTLGSPCSYRMALPSSEIWFKHLSTWANPVILKRVQQVVQPTVPFHCVPAIPRTATSNCTIILLKGNGSTQNHSILWYHFWCWYYTEHYMKTWVLHQLLKINQIFNSRRLECRGVYGFWTHQSWGCEAHEASMSKIHIRRRTVVRVIYTP